MKILMLTQWFQPEPTFKGLPLARALRDRGHEVEVLTGFPNYPGGKVYPGYRVRPWSRETIDGIRVNRVALYPSHNKSAARRMLNYASFAAASALIGPVLVRKPDVVHIFNLVTLDLTASLLKYLKGARTVLDVQDLWPESLAGSGLMNNPFLLGIVDRWSRSAYRRADRIIALSPGFKRHLVARGVPEDRIDVIYNWCDEEALILPERDPRLADELGFTGRFNIVFAGNMGPAQALDSTIIAARKLQELAPEVLFTFVGRGIEVEHLKRLAGDLTNVRFLPGRPMSEIGSVLECADVLLVNLRSDPLFEITIPSKIQAYMFAGKPILCGVGGDAADLVGRADAGLSLTPENPDALVAAVLELMALAPDERRRMGENGRKYYQAHLAMEHGIRQMEAVFAAAIAAPVAGRASRGWTDSVRLAALGKRGS
jgi:colanic acid biosynthesis glycosyl transferase WcaI